VRALPQAHRVVPERLAETHESRLAIIQSPDDARTQQASPSCPLPDSVLLPQVHRVIPELLAAIDHAIIAAAAAETPGGRPGVAEASFSASAVGLLQAPAALRTGSEGGAQKPDTAVVAETLSAHMVYLRGAGQEGEKSCGQGTGAG
jgi:hypothetical protein